MSFSADFLGLSPSPACFQPTSSMLAAPPPSSLKTARSTAPKKVDHMYRDFSQFAPTEDDRQQHKNRLKKVAAMRKSMKDPVVQTQISTRNDNKSNRGVVEELSSTCDECDRNHSDMFQGTNFVAVLHNILSCPEFSSIITWLPHGRSWSVLDPNKLIDIVMSDPFVSKFCKMTQYASFQRQVSGWGFKRITSDPERKRDHYYHELFLRGMPHLVKSMRRLPSGRNKGRSLPDPKNEPNFFKLSELYPLVDFFGEDSLSRAKPNTEGAIEKNLESTNSMNRTTSSPSSPTKEKGRNKNIESTVKQQALHISPIHPSSYYGGSVPLPPLQQNPHPHAAASQLQPLKHVTTDLMPMSLSTGGPPEGVSPPALCPPGYTPPQTDSPSLIVLLPNPVGHAAAVESPPPIPVGYPATESMPITSPASCITPSVTLARTAQIANQAAQIRALQEQVKHLTAHRYASAQLQHQIQSLQEQVKALQ